MRALTGPVATHGACKNAFAGRSRNRRRKAAPTRQLQRCWVGLASSRSGPGSTPNGGGLLNASPGVVVRRLWARVCVSAGALAPSCARSLACSCARALVRVLSCALRLVTHALARSCVPALLSSCCSCCSCAHALPCLFARVRLRSRARALVRSLVQLCARVALVCSCA